MSLECSTPIDINHLINTIKPTIKLYIFGLIFLAILILISYVAPITSYVPIINV